MNTVNNCDRKRKLSLAEADDVRLRLAAGERVADVARAFGVKWRVIGDIKLGRTCNPDKPRVNPVMKGEKNPKAVYSERQVGYAKWLHNRGYGREYIARVTGIKKTSLWRICHGFAWRHVDPRRMSPLEYSRRSQKPESIRLGIVL